MFIAREISQAYENAPRFDESHLCEEAAYLDLIHKIVKMDELLHESLSPSQWELFMEYVGLLYEECEFECMHYFEQAWLMAQRPE